MLYFSFVWRDNNYENQLNTLNAKLVANHHRSLVIQLLRQRGPMSRAEIAKTLGLASSVVTRLVRELISVGCVVETERLTTEVGRPPMLIEFNSDYATAIGAHIQRDKLECAVVNAGGKILSRWEMPLSSPPNPDQAIHSLVQAINALKRDNTVGIGVAVSGLVDIHTGCEIFSPVLGWENIELRKIIENASGLNVRIENDANALAIAELLYGAGKNYSDFVCVMVGEGLGSGLVIGRKLYRGAFGGAGEIGHTAINCEDSAPICRCGERGCLEEFCSNRALNKKAKILGYENWRTMATAARGGDSEARKSFEQFGRWLGLGIKNVVNVLNPQAVIIGGELMEAEDLFLRTVAEIVCKHSFPRGRMAPDVLSWQVGQAGFLLGAAGLAIEEFLSSPISRG